MDARVAFLARPPALTFTLPPLAPTPALRTHPTRCRANATKQWAVRHLHALCALAPEARAGEHDVEEWAPRLPHVALWAVRGQLGPPQLRALLRLPRLRHVQAWGLALPSEDHSQQACQWEALTIKLLPNARHLLRLPCGLGRVTVTEWLVLPRADLEEEAEEEEGEDMEALRQLWVGSGRLQACAAAPSSDMVAYWRLSAEEAKGGFFRLSVPDARAVAARAWLLQGAVLPSGGGPRCLAVEGAWSNCSAARLLRPVAPLLAGTRVRTLCVRVRCDFVDLGGVLGAVPPSVAAVHLALDAPVALRQAREVLSRPAAAHPLRLVLLMPSGGRYVEEERWELRGCAPFTSPGYVSRWCRGGPWRLVAVGGGEKRHPFSVSCGRDSLTTLWSRWCAHVIPRGRGGAPRV